ncbi:hypothetical protein KIN20_036524 [Parelaphostrongylus tenuis]|uniref:Glycosyltransferase family 92 protein n=1 Tax=Parelaphostrongylus tenuis TaxID=148309 RepID=A0AAD5RD52_PARTN|nr:hypothetical protein KIN20_036524 [Parelaphostrongylus tenuis]
MPRRNYCRKCTNEDNGRDGEKNHTALSSAARHAHGCRGYFHQVHDNLRNSHDHERRYGELVEDRCGRTVVNRAVRMLASRPLGSHFASASVIFGVPCEDSTLTLEYAGSDCYPRDCKETRSTNMSTTSKKKTNNESNATSEGQLREHYSTPDLHEFNYGVDTETCFARLNPLRRREYALSISLLESGLSRFSTLQAVLPSIIAVDVNSDEAAQRSQKLLRISQLQIEYLLKSQHQLLEQIKKLEDDLLLKRKEVKQLKATILHSDAPFYREIERKLGGPRQAVESGSEKPFSGTKTNCRNKSRSPYTKCALKEFLYIRRGDLCVIFQTGLDLLDNIHDLNKYMPVVYFVTQQNLNTVPRKSAKKGSQLIQRSVLLRYGDTDPLVIFSAHKHDGYITVVLYSYGYLMRRLFCRLFDEQLRELIPAFESRVFPEFIVRCPASDIARFVAVSLNPDDKVTIGDMHDVEKSKLGSEAFFSVCLAPLWGSTPKWLMLIEFIEYYRMQGAEYFYIYKHDCDNLTQSVLDSYVSGWHCRGRGNL